MINGEEHIDRTGIGTKSIFGTQLRWNMQQGFPAVTTKKLAWKSVVSELLWFIEGSTNERRLAEILYEKPQTELEGKKTIWTANFEKQGKELGYSDGELGPIYGYQWRHWMNHDIDNSEIDQLQNVISTIKTNPNDRRMIVTAWNPSDIAQMALPPCHYSYQFNVSGSNNEYLSLLWNQRSVDSFLGLPFNIASYGLLLSIVAKITDKIPKDLVFNGGNTHIYMNQINQVKEQLSREPYPLPILEMPDFKTLDDLKDVKVSDFKLINYLHDDKIKAEMAV